ncbi:MAG: peptidylprolyl isomerase [Ruminococcaceae bacterium]|nr:peptidylprolyl isomerase [Oscillospiraceae bacterium]
MKRLIFVFTLILALLLTGCANVKQTSGDGNNLSNNEQELKYPFEIIESKEIIEAEIILDNGNTIKLDLYPEIAPITVSNFKYLADEKFYDGLIFHRVIEGFMIQGGCPNGIGNGGPNYRIKGEFLANGVENDLEHTRGVISMARSSANDSAGSQFFIMHNDAPHLDGQYAAFGRVTEGIEFVDEIATCETDANDKPLKDIKIKTIIVK